MPVYEVDYYGFTTVVADSKEDAEAEVLSKLESGEIDTAYAEVDGVRELPSNAI